MGSRPAAAEMQSLGDAPGQRWPVSPWNREGLDAQAIAALHPRISDCTLRDGEQQAGVYFTVDDKVDIARALAAIGVSDIEAGTPASSRADAEAIEQIAAAGLSSQISALARAIESDIDLVARCGADGVRISFPISSIQRSTKVRLSDDDYLRQALHLSDYAKRQGLSVVFSPYDTTRADIAFLGRVLRALDREGTVDRVRLVDTVGGATPESIRYLVAFTRATCGIPIEIHCHNDLGLATANTVAAALAGADYLSVTVNGLGERAGNASFEECVMVLQVLYGVAVPIDTQQLTKLSRLVERRSKVRMQPQKAIVGRNAFRHETGTVVAGVLEDPATAEPYAPSRVGQHRRIVLGRKSGAAAIAFKAAGLGRTLSQDQVRTVLAAVKDRSTQTGRPVGDAEFSRLVGDVAAGDA